MSDLARLPVPRDPLEDDPEVEAAMSRHPAGRRQRRPRPLPAELGLPSVITVDAVGEPIEAR